MELPVTEVYVKLNFHIRYAIDWQQEERLVTVIIPGKRQATCILKLDGNYPATRNIECTRVDEQLKDKMELIKEKVKISFLIYSLFI